ncbi:MFS transporter [Zhengella mangrovi]|nr:MFS transporter [Zhengella mangrovi]
MTQVSPPAAASGMEGHPQRWPALFTLLTAAFMNLIDVTIVNVALPTLQENLHAGPSEIEWVVAVYVLGFALALLPFGRLGDMAGRKRMFMLGVLLFTLFSALCGLAPNIETLIVARTFQGLAGGMMTPQVLAIAQVIFPPRERAQAFSLFGLAAGLASVVGPLLGGTLIGADFMGLDWRPIFLVNIPVGLAVLVIGQKIIPDLPGHPDVGTDFKGVLIGALGVFLLIFPMVEGHNFGWPAWLFALMAAAFAFFALFFRHTRRQQAARRPQLIPYSLLANGNFMLGAGIATLFFSGVAGFFMVFAIFLQTGFGLTPLQSGLTTIPFPIGVLTASLLSGRLKGRYPRQRLVGGAVLMAAGMGLLDIVISSMGDTATRSLMAAPLFIGGLGLGMGIASLFQTILAGVPHKDAGAGSGTLQSFQQMGNALGIAVCGQIFFATLGVQKASGADMHPAFIASMKGALIYEIAAFLAVAVLVNFLKAPPTGHDEPSRAQPPTPVEA